MVDRPTERALRGRNDVIASPGRIDASSGGMALGEALRGVGRLAVAASARAGDQLSREVAQIEKERGRQEALRGKTTTLATGQQVPTVALRSDNTLASQAFNEGVMEILPNRLQAELVRSMTEIEDQQRGNPKAYTEEAKAYFQAFNMQVPDKLKDDFELQFERTLAAGSRRQGAILARRETARSRFENNSTVETLTGQAEREAFNLVTVNPEERGVAGAIVQDSRARIEELLEQADPMGEPIYTPDQKTAILDAFDQRVVMQSALGGFERAIDKEAYVGKWIEQQRQDGDLGFDEIDRIGARLTTELRRHNAAVTADSAEFRREVRAAVDVLGAGRDVSGFLNLRQRAEARGDAAAVEALDLASSHRDAALAFGQKPLAEQVEDIRAVRDKPAADAIQQAQNLALEQTLTKIHVAAKKALNPESPSYAPYSYAEASGIVPQVARLQTFSQDEIETRLMQRDEIQNVLKQDLPFLAPGEASRVAQVVEEGDVETGVAIFRRLNAAPEEERPGIAQQLSAKDPAIARAYQLSSTPGGERSAVRILEGLQLLATENIGTVRPTAQAMRNAMGTVFANIGGTDPNFFAQASQAVEATYLSLLTERGETDLNETLLNDAARLVAGGVEKIDGTVQGGPFDFGGQRMLPPAPGVTEDQFEDLLASLSQGDMATYSVDGAPPTLSNGQPLNPELLLGGRTGFVGLFNADPFQFQSVGQGRYLIRTNSGAVVKTKAGPYVIDLGQAWKDGRGQ